MKDHGILSNVLINVPSHKRFWFGLSKRSVCDATKQINVKEVTKVGTESAKEGKEDRDGRHGGFNEDDATWIPTSTAACMSNETTSEDAEEIQDQDDDDDDWTSTTGSAVSIPTPEYGSIFNMDVQPRNTIETYRQEAYSPRHPQFTLTSSPFQVHTPRPLPDPRDQFYSRRHVAESNGRVHIQIQPPEPCSPSDSTDQSFISHDERYLQHLVRKDLYASDTAELRLTSANLAAITPTGSPVEREQETKMRVKRRGTNSDSSIEPNSTIFSTPERGPVDLSWELYQSPYESSMDAYQGSVASISDSSETLRGVRFRVAHAEKGHMSVAERNSRQGRAKAWFSQQAKLQMTGTTMVKVDE